LVAGRADITVITVLVIGSVGTSLRGVTCIVCAGVFIVTRDRIFSLALSIKACVVRGTGVVVIAASFVVRAETALRGVTTIICTWIGVVAFKRWTTLAESISAAVLGRANVSIIAIVVVRFKAASRFWVASVVRTRVSVRTIELGSSDADAIVTSISKCACIVI